VAERWLNDQPDANAKELFHRLQTELSVSFDPGQLRTLQRRVKEWRTAIAVAVTGTRWNGLAFFGRICLPREITA
jgi:hypothetical protein